MLQVASLTPTQDESVQIMNVLLKHNHPFFFLRYGDGALECIHGLGRGYTCDGEVYTTDLSKALQHSWQIALQNPSLFVHWQITVAGMTKR